MKRNVTCVLFASAAFAVSACAEEGGGDGPSAEVAINVAPYTLVGATNACYNIIVKELVPGTSKMGNTGSNEVVTLTNICATGIGAGAPSYGFGSSISYVTPCSAAGNIDGDPDGERWNSVTLELVDLYNGATDIADDEYVNPCPPGGGKCVKNFLCSENSDEGVDFDITVMMDANQGFFDIAVNFEDVFCSAKFDTCYPEDADLSTPNVIDPTWIQLLFRKDTPTSESYRWDTGVLAFACTGGKGTTQTSLYMDDVVIRCSGAGATRLNPSLGPGNVPALNDVVFGYANYFGDEQLDCGFTNDPADCKKKYWNMAIGFKTSPTHTFGNDVGSCWLYGSATASSGEFEDDTIITDDWVTPANTKYPVVRFRVPISVPRVDSESIYDYQCAHWGLDDQVTTATVGGSTVRIGVWTEYTSFECGIDDTHEFSDGVSTTAPEDCDFCHHFDGMESSTRSECPGSILE